MNELITCHYCDRPYEATDDRIFGFVLYGARGVLHSADIYKCPRCGATGKKHGATLAYEALREESR